jgi:hypothetical protein
MFVYPWDVARVGPEALVERFAAEGVTRIAVAATYLGRDSRARRARSAGVPP